MESAAAAAAAAAQAPVMSCRSPTCPPWLQAAIADMEQRVRALALDEAPPTEHSFAERAENYYQKRPQLLSLLTDLHRRYLILAERYAQSLSIPHHRHKDLSCSSSLPLPAASSDDDCSSGSSSSDDVDDDGHCSDADSSLSYQHPPPPVGGAGGTSSSGGGGSSTSPAELELVAAELVCAWVDRDVAADEAARRAAESARKVQLQGSLVEVLESERLVLLGENARLGFRASAAEAEAAAAAAELGLARRRANAEMARLVARLRDGAHGGHRACVLGRGKVEALRAQVCALELRNRAMAAAWEAERRAAAAEVHSLRADNRRLADEAAAAAAARRKRKGWRSGGGWWWARVRMAAEWTPCAPPASATTVTVRKVGGEQVKVKGKDGGGKYYYGGGCFCV